jgi:hypothetical protein
VCPPDLYHLVDLNKTPTNNRPRVSVENDIRRNSRRFSGNPSLSLPLPTPAQNFDQRLSRGSSSHLLPLSDPEPTPHTTGTTASTIPPIPNQLERNTTESIVPKEVSAKTAQLEARQRQREAMHTIPTPNASHTTRERMTKRGFAYDPAFDANSIQPSSAPLSKSAKSQSSSQFLMSAPVLNLAMLPHSQQPQPPQRPVQDPPQSSQPFTSNSLSVTIPPNPTPTDPDSNYVQVVTGSSSHTPSSSAGPLSAASWKAPQPTALAGVGVGVGGGVGGGGGGGGVSSLTAPIKSLPKNALHDLLLAPEEKVMRGKGVKATHHPQQTQPAQNQLSISQVTQITDQSVTIPQTTSVNSSDTGPPIPIPIPPIPPVSIVAPTSQQHSTPINRRPSKPSPAARVTATTGTGTGGGKAKTLPSSPAATTGMRSHRNPSDATSTHPPSAAGVHSSEQSAKSRRSVITKKERPTSSSSVSTTGTDSSSTLRPNSSTNGRGVKPLSESKTTIQQAAPPGAVNRKSSATLPSSVLSLSSTAVRQSSHSHALTPSDRSVTHNQRMKPSVTPVRGAGTTGNKQISTGYSRQNSIGNADEVPAAPSLPPQTPAKNPFGEIIDKSPPRAV